MLNQNCLIRVTIPAPRTTPNHATSSASPSVQSSIEKSLATDDRLQLLDLLYNWNPLIKIFVALLDLPALCCAALRASYSPSSLCPIRRHSSITWSVFLRKFAILLVSAFEAVCASSWAGTAVTFCRILPLHPSTNVKLASNTTGDSSRPFSSSVRARAPTCGNTLRGALQDLVLPVELGDGERDTTVRLRSGRVWNMSEGGSAKPRRTGVKRRGGAGGGRPAKLDDVLNGKEASLPQLEERKKDDVEKLDGVTGIVFFCFWFFLDVDAARSGLLLANCRVCDFKITGWRSANDGWMLRGG